MFVGPFLGLSNSNTHVVDLFWVAEDSVTPSFGTESLALVSAEFGKATVQHFHGACSMKGVSVFQLSMVTSFATLLSSSKSCLLLQPWAYLVSH